MSQKNQKNKGPVKLLLNALVGACLDLVAMILAMTITSALMVLDLSLRMMRQWMPALEVMQIRGHCASKGHPSTDETNWRRKTSTGRKRERSDSEDEMTEAKRRERCLEECEGRSADNYRTVFIPSRSSESETECLVDNSVMSSKLSVFTQSSDAEVDGEGQDKTMQLSEVDCEGGSDDKPMPTQLSEVESHDKQMVAELSEVDSEDQHKLMSTQLPELSEGHDKPMTAQSSEVDSKGQDKPMSTQLPEPGEDHDTPMSTQLPEPVECHDTSMSTQLPEPGEGHDTPMSTKLPEVDSEIKQLESTSTNSSDTELYSEDSKDSPESADCSLRSYSSDSEGHKQNVKSPNDDATHHRPASVH